MFQDKLYLLYVEWEKYFKERWYNIPQSHTFLYTRLVSCAMEQFLKNTLDLISTLKLFSTQLSTNCTNNGMSHSEHCRKIYSGKQKEKGLVSHVCLFCKRYFLLVFPTKSLYLLLALASTFQSLAVLLYFVVIMGTLVVTFFNCTTTTSAAERRSTNGSFLSAIINEVPSFKF